jgi:F-type H+-transporting ATPase subunit alpha
VGGNAQIKAMKKIASSLRLDLASFRELEAFAQLGTDLDQASQRQLDRGARMVELLKQAQYEPLSIEEQLISIFAGTQGLLDDIKVSLVREFEAAMLKHFRDEAAGVLAEVGETKALTDELSEQIKKVVSDFKSHWDAVESVV